MQVQHQRVRQLALIVLMARYFSRDDVSARKGQYGLVDLWRPFVFVLIPVATGDEAAGPRTALVTFSIAMTMIVFAKVRWQSLTRCSPAASPPPSSPERLLKPYQKSRIVTSRPGRAYAKGAGYHASSRHRGRQRQWEREGVGRRTAEPAQLPPEQHTDFIFSVWAEEHGFLGGVLLLSLYGFLVLTALDVAANARDKFGSSSPSASPRCSSARLHQHRMVTGLLPVVQGVPLPALQLRRSSVLADLLGVGILLNVSLRRFMF